MNENGFSGENVELERRLRSLAPAPSRIAGDALMFRAGQASARRRPLVWPLVSLAMTALAAVFGSLLLSRPAPPVRERVIVVVVTRAAPQPAPVNVGPVETAAGAPTPVERVPLGEWSYGKLTSEVLAKGLDALPSFKSGSSEKDSLDDLLGPLRPSDKAKPSLLKPSGFLPTWGGTS